MNPKLHDTFKETADRIAFLDRGYGINRPDVQSALEKIYSEINRETPTLEIVSVKDFGAIGDGLSDDTKSIQDAIDYSHNQGGGVVFFPIGKYNISSSLVLKEGVTALGMGINSILNMQNLETRMMIAHSHTRIRDLFFEGNRGEEEDDSNGTVGVYIWQGITDVIIDGCYFHNTKSDGVYIMSAYAQETAKGDIIVRNCEFVNNGRQGLCAVDYINVLFEGNRIINARINGINLESNLTSNDFSIAAKVVNNFVLNSGDKGIWYQGSEINNPDKNSLHIFGFNHIINSSTDGLFVGRGYDVVIQGNTIQGNGETGNGIQITNSSFNISILGNTIRKHNRGIYVDRWENISISGNIITDNVTDGISLFATGSSLIGPASITNNIISGNGARGIQTFDLFWRECMITVVGNTLLNNGTGSFQNDYLNPKVMLVYGNHRDDAVNDRLLMADSAGKLYTLSIIDGIPTATNLDE